MSRSQSGHRWNSEEARRAGQAGGSVCFPAKGYAAMEPANRFVAQSKGGRNSQLGGKGPRLQGEKARQAGRKGGRTRARLARKSREFAIRVASGDWPFY